MQSCVGGGIGGKNALRANTEEEKTLRREQEATSELKTRGKEKRTKNAIRASSTGEEEEEETDSPDGKRGGGGNRKGN